jgi:hypothetical protein
VIAIVNVSKRLRKTGWHTYELRINEAVVTTFKHRREQGLSQCLLRAAEAASRADLEHFLAINSLFANRESKTRGKE